MRKHTVLGFSLGLAAMACPFALSAQNLDMPQAPAAPAAQTTVVRGQSMAQVERQFGAPAERYAAVGQPPITRWVYPSMIVFFEYDHVVHAVALRR